MPSKTFAKVPSSGMPLKELSFACEVKATNSRTHFKEYRELFQNS